MSSSLSVRYKPSHYLPLPVPPPSATAPDLSPNTSSSSSGYSSCISPSVSICPSTSATSDDADTPPCVVSQDRDNRSDFMQTGISKSTMILAKKSSRPSLRHMPSWGSFISHRSRNLVDSDADDNEDEDEDEDGIHEQKLGIKDGVVVFGPSGIFDDAAEDLMLDGRYARSPSRDWERQRESSAGSVSSRKGGRKYHNHGDTVFARALKKLSLSNLAHHAEQQEAEKEMDISKDTQIIAVTGHVTDQPESIEVVTSEQMDGTQAYVQLPVDVQEKEDSDSNTSSSLAGALPSPPDDRPATPLNHPSEISLKPVCVSNTPTHARKTSVSSVLTSLPSMPELSPTSPQVEEYFTPPTIPTALLQHASVLPTNPNLPKQPQPFRLTATQSHFVRPPMTKSTMTVGHHARFATTATPFPTPTKDIHTHTHVHNFEDCLNDTTAGFTLDIFSPRIQAAPALKGLVDTDSNPVSPLELPSPQVNHSLMVLALGPARPTGSPVRVPHIPPPPGLQQTPASATSAFIAPPVASPHLTGSFTMPSLGQAVGTLKTSSPVPQDPSALLKPSDSQTTTPPRPQPSQTRPLPSTAPIYRLPRASIPSGKTPSPIPARFGGSQLPGGMNHPQPTWPTYSRRHSAIIRPPIFPTPTPPSLINSPRSLGTPLIPLGPTSPYRIDTINGAPPDVLPPPDEIPDLLPTNRVRENPSLKRKAQIRAAVAPVAPMSSSNCSTPTQVSPISTSASSGSAGLGLGAINGAGSGFRKMSVTIPIVSDNIMIYQGPEDRKEEHVATPGTFGLQGEAEKRMMMEGVNPYFA